VVLNEGDIAPLVSKEGVLRGGELILGSRGAVNFFSGDGTAGSEQG